MLIEWRGGSPKYFGHGAYRSLDSMISALPRGAAILLLPRTTPPAGSVAHPKSKNLNFREDARLKAAWFERHAFVGERRGITLSIGAHVAGHSPHSTAAARLEALRKAGGGLYLSDPGFFLRNGDVLSSALRGFAAPAASDPCGGGGGGGGGGLRPFAMSFPAGDAAVDCALAGLRSRACPDAGGGDDGWACLEAALRACLPDADNTLARAAAGGANALIDWCAWTAAAAEWTAAGRRPRRAVAWVGAAARNGSWAPLANDDDDGDDAVAGPHGAAPASAPCHAFDARSCDASEAAAMRSHWGFRFDRVRSSTGGTGGGGLYSKCVPNILLPGVAKSGTTALFRLLVKNFRVLRAVAGGHDRKESSFFTGVGRRSRASHPGPGGYCKHRFSLLPAIRPRDARVHGLQTADATVWMVEQWGEPKNILRANPEHARAVILLRDPVARAYSDYRYFTYNERKHLPAGEQESFAQYARRSVRNLRDCHAAAERKHGGATVHGLSRDAVLPAVSRGGIVETEAMARSKFQCNPDADVGRGANGISRSIYVYKVWRWRRVLGADRVLVVRSEDLRATPRAVLLRVGAFLRLRRWRDDGGGGGGGDASAPFELMDEQNKGSRESKMPARMRITDATRAMLREFYRPFNRKLEALVGRSLGWDE